MSFLPTAFWIKNSETQSFPELNREFLLEVSQNVEVRTAERYVKRRYAAVKSMDFNAASASP